MAQEKYSDHKWWKEAVVYQIYPASFKSTGSGSDPGWGDVKGITSKLDYLQELGVDVVWLSPIYKSPQVDMGYDISDYYDIDERYGTLQDVDKLIAGLKQRGMKLMMDFVANHTSDLHSWFVESRSSKDSPKRDWYIWKPAKVNADGEREPPNNWSMILGEANSAWTWDEKTQEYYLSLFCSGQPDLNWENPDVRKAVHDVLKFWLDRGTSGFRMDVINHISKIQSYGDAEIRDPSVKYQPGWAYYANGPRLHEWLQEMNREVLEPYGAMTVGEMPFVNSDQEILDVVNPNRKELNMIFIFAIVDIDQNAGDFRMTLKDWAPPKLRDIISHWQSTMIEGNGWNSVFVENHDNPRSISRYADDSDQHRERCAQLLALMTTTLGGTLYVYQGQELGQRNAPADWPEEEWKDIETINYWQKIQPIDPQLGRKVIHAKARDHSRTPVQWSAEPNAGFCAPDAKPWMRVVDDYKTVNAAAQEKAPAPGKLSTLQFWRRALKNRKANKDVFVYGGFELLDNEHESVFAYKRTHREEGDESAFVTVLNFTGSEVSWTVPESAKVQKWVAWNEDEGAPEKEVSGTIKLGPWEGLLGVAKK